MEVTTLGIDVAKSIFQLHGVNAHGKVALQKRVTRGKLLETVGQLRDHSKPGAKSESK